MQGPLSAAVARMGHALLPQVSPNTAAGIRGVLARLDGPLQIAVAGRIKAGKSTLVNALIGRRIAATDVGECTRVVTRFQYGTVDRIEVVHTDGHRSTLPLAPDGGIPADLGVDLNTVSHLEAFLTSGLLSDITVIDTPGLGSLDAASVSRTEVLLGAATARRGHDQVPGTAGQPDGGGANTSGGAAPTDGGDDLDPVSSVAIAGAEAVVYVFTQGVRADDAAVLSAFTAATASRDAGPVNALAVLNKADTIPPESVEGSDGDPVKAARIVAATQASILRPRVADVLPVIGLLGETVETGAFSARDADSLRVLAGADPAMFGAMMMAADLFTTLDSAVEADQRLRLLELLDLHGIRFAVELLRAEPTMGASELRRRLLDASGIDNLRDQLGQVFASRADGIKASAALASLAALAAASRDWAERQRIHDAIEVMLQRPEAHQFRMLEALTLLSSGGVQLPEDLTDEVLRLGGSTRPDQRLGLPGAAPTDLVAAALERANFWRGYAAYGGTPGQSRIAHVVHRTYFLLWQELRGAAPAPIPGQLAGGPPPPGQPRSPVPPAALGPSGPSGPPPGYRPAPPPPGYGPPPYGQPPGQPHGQPGPVQPGSGPFGPGQPPPGYLPPRGRSQ